MVIAHAYKDKTVYMKIKQPEAEKWLVNNAGESKSTVHVEYKPPVIYSKNSLNAGEREKDRGRSELPNHIKDEKSCWCMGKVSVITLPIRSHSLEDISFIMILELESILDHPHYWPALICTNAEKKLRTEGHQVSFFHWKFPGHWQHHF